MVDVRSYIGPIDIYWFDQIVRGRVEPGMKILDAACGSGRNLIYLMREGYDCYGLDADPKAIETVRWLAGELAPETPEDHFRRERIQDSTFPDGLADAVISSAILHLARSDVEFRAMLLGSWRLLAPGGLFFCRLASTIGIEKRVRPIKATPSRRRFHLPDGSERYLVDDAFLQELETELGAERLDTLKTTLVHDQRSMTTWVLRKNGG